MKSQSANVLKWENMNKSKELKRCSICDKEFEPKTFEIHVASCSDLKIAKSCRDLGPLKFEEIFSKTSQDLQNCPHCGKEIDSKTFKFHAEECKRKMAAKCLHQKNCCWEYRGLFFY